MRYHSRGVRGEIAARERGEYRGKLCLGYIAPFQQARVWKHEERRRRKLLVSRKELARLWNATQRKGMTLVPLVMYFNDRGLVKLKIGIAKGKKNHDKRETEAKRDWARQKQRLLKES
jgi:SsrA-binding protein